MPAGTDADPGCRDQRARDPRPRAVGRRAAHPRLRRGPRRRGVRGGAGRPARSARVCGSQRIVARLRELGLPIDAEIERTRQPPTTTRSGRPTIARALMAAGHAESVEDAFSRLIGHGAARLRAARGPRARARRSTRSGPPAACRSSPTSARRRPGTDIVRELVEAGLAGLEVYYRSFDAATRDRAWARSPTSLGLARDRRHRLPRRPRPVRRGPRRPLGPARGRLRLLDRLALTAS